MRRQRPRARDGYARDVNEGSIRIATAERIALELLIAGVGYRILAYAIDVLTLFAAWAILFFGLSFLTSDLLGWAQSLSGLTRVVLVVGVFTAQWVYWTACEVAFGGRTIGKRALGIRVVRSDGAPVTVVESALRNLFRWIDFLPFGYAAGMISMLLTQRNRRIGDLIAGTMIIRDRAISLEKYAAIESATPIVSSRPLAPEESELIFDFCARANLLEPTAASALAGALLDRFVSTLPEEERARLAAHAPEAAHALRSLAQGSAR